MSKNLEVQDDVLHGRDRGHRRAALADPPGRPGCPHPQAGPEVQSVSLLAAGGLGWFRATYIRTVLMTSFDSEF